MSRNTTGSVEPPTAAASSQTGYLVHGEYVGQGAGAFGCLDCGRNVGSHRVLTEREAMEFVDRGQSSGFGAGGLPRLVKCGDVVFDVLFGYGVRFVDAAGFEPINVFGDVGFVGGDGGRGESSLHADVDEELLGESGESVGHSAHGTKKPRSEAGFLV